MNHLSNVHPPRIHPQFVYRLPFLSWLKRLLEMTYWSPTTGIPSFDQNA